MLGNLLITVGIDGITIRIMIESILVRRAACKSICLNILTAWDKMVSLTMFQHLLIRWTVRTLNKERITGRELSKPTRLLDLMNVVEVPDQPHIS